MLKHTWHQPKTDFVKSKQNNNLKAAALRNEEARGVSPHLWDPEGDVWFVEAHGQEEAAGVPLSPVP